MKEGVSFIHWIHNYFWCVDVAGRLQNMKKKMFINWIFLTVLLTFDSMELNFVLFGFYFVKKFFKNHAWINPLIDWHVDVVAKRMKRSGDFCWFFFSFLFWKFWKELKEEQRTKTPELFEGLQRPHSSMGNYDWNANHQKSVPEDLIRHKDSSDTSTASASNRSLMTMYSILPSNPRRSTRTEWNLTFFFFF